MNDTLKMKGTYHLLIKDKDGNKKADVIIPNIIMNAGKAQLALLAGDATAVPFTYFALGTSNTAVAASQTALGAEVTTNGLARTVAAVSRITTTVTNDTMQLLYKWTCSGGSTVIEEVGVFNASSSGTMLSRALAVSKTMVTGDELTLTYTIQFS
jgi:hypothetical protein